MRCPTCDAENPEQAQFCLNCGRRLVLTCPECGTRLPPQAKFCLSCGAQLAGPPPETEEQPGNRSLDRALQRLIPRELAERLRASGGQVGGERRLVTILFCDVEGSTAIAEALDPEDVMEIMDGAFDVLIEPIARYEGTVARLMGDAVLAFFGAPIAHEDDPERAIRAALEIVEGASAYGERLERERGIEGFSVRVGINTGRVVVGEVGSDLRVEYTAMGDAVNLAARMEQAADPGTVLITEDTYRLVAPIFETEALGTLVVKGRTDPVPIYRVVAPERSPGRIRGFAALDSPLIGREAELQALHEATDRLQAGVGGMVTVVGEAGIGKSRLAAELRRQVLEGTNRRGGRCVSLRWVEGRCLSYGTSIAYHLWSDVLRGLLGVSQEDGPQAVGGTLRDFVQTSCPGDADEISPYVGRILALPLTDEEETHLRALEGETLRANTFRAIERLMEATTEESPCVLVCEDLHWADSISLALLERLLVLPDRVPLLIVCLFRPRPRHGSWSIREVMAREHPHRHLDLELRPLSPDDSRRLLAHILQVDKCPARLGQRILAHSEGNPLFVEEIIRSLMTSGAIVRCESTKRWQVTSQAADFRLAETLQGVLTARIDRLDERPRAILRRAAVIGRIFEHRVLAAITSDCDGLAGHLVTLQREGMVRERARIPELEYIFKHELIREAAYTGLLRKERRTIHRQVAEALERLHPDRAEEQVELLAHHWERSGAVEKAIAYLTRAGDRARQAGASLEAVDFYHRALQQAEDQLAQGLAAAPDRLHERLGDVYLENLSQHEAAIDHYESLLAMAESPEDRARGARKLAVIHLLRGDLAAAQAFYESALTRLASDRPTPEANRIHCGLAYVLVSKNRLEDAVDHAVEGLEIAEQISDTRGVADASEMLGLIADRNGDMEKACEYLERSLACYRELEDLGRTAQACNNVADTYRLWGQMDRALAHLEEGLRLARRIGNTRDEALILQTTAELYLDQGDWESALIPLERAMTLAEESGVVARVIEVHRITGLACAGADRLEEAGRHLDTAEDLSRKTEHLRFAPQIFMDQANLHAAQGDLHEASTHLEMALTAAGEAPSPLFLGRWHRARGKVSSGRNQWHEAVTELEESLKHLEPAHLPADVGETRLLLGQAYARRGRRGDRGRAREQLLAALSIYQRIQARRYVAQADRELELLE